MKSIKYYILGLFILMAIMLVIVDFLIFDFNFYLNAFDKYNVYENIQISKDNLSIAFENLLNYLKHKTNYIVNDAMMIDGVLQPFYKKRELMHMVDVKNLILTMQTIKHIVIFLLIVIYTYIFIIKKNFNFNDFYSGLKKAFVTLLSIVLCLIFYVFLDFQHFWIVFHEVLFNNDLYILDPKHDFLIRVLRLEVFGDLVTKILVFILLAFILLFSICTFIKRRYNHD